MCNNLTIKIINTLRLLSVDMVDKSNSGHPGMPIGCAPMMFVLWCKIMNFNPDVPLWNNRDRFILSNGHGCALLYSMLYLLGYNYSMDDLQNFRQIHSKTPGHPEYNKNLGIEVSTGPLGQGIANGVGMAIASKKMGLDNQIYVMCGDGCLMEGISYESASLAGHLGLNNLIVLYDDNGITIDGKTDITFTENVRGRFIALNWNILEVADGDNDVNDIYDKITTSLRCNLRQNKVR
jgi:transketolase